MVRSATVALFLVGKLLLLVLCPPPRGHLCRLSVNDCEGSTFKFKVVSGGYVQENIAEKKFSTDSLAEAIPNVVSIIGLDKIEPSWFSRNHSLAGGESPPPSSTRPANGSCRRRSQSPFGSSRIQSSHIPLKQSGSRSYRNRASLSQNTSAVAWAGFYLLAIRPGLSV